MSFKQTREARQNTQFFEAPSQEGQAASTIDRKMVWVLAAACALGAANLYYIQPLLADIARSFAVSEAAAGLIATLSQAGFALGLLLLVPLGDAFERRLLVPLALVGVTIALIATALAPTIALLALASFVVGVTTVVPQIIVPLGASLAAPQERGRVVGTIMSGLLIGLLLARTVSGFIGAEFGWRTMYWIAAVLMLALAVVLRLMLPRERPSTRISYPGLMRSLWGFMRSEPVLREASLFGAMGFGAFSVFWVTLSFYLQSPPYHFGSTVAGLFGLVGIAGASAASVVGRLSDRISARTITGAVLVCALLSFVVFWLLGQWLWGLVIGVILLDLGTQGIHISNQTRIFSLQTEARSRLNTMYMVSYFVGGSLGSLLGTFGWDVAGWNGVCFVGVLMLVVALVAHISGSLRRAKA